jgi:hypothetical protein
MWWLLVPAGAMGLSYLSDRFALNDLRLTLPDDKLTYGILGVRTGADVVRTISYVGFEPGLSDTGAAVSDGLYGALTVGMGIAAFVQPRGGDPELYFMMNGLGDIGAARAHRHLGRGWGSLLQLGAGAVLIPVGIWGIGLERPTVGTSGDPMYAPPDLPPGSRDVAGNPYESSRFPNAGLNVTILGANQLFSGLVYGISYLSTGRAPDPSTPRVSASPTAGGAMFNLTGTF